MRLTVSDMTRVSLFTAMAIVAALILRFGGAAIIPYSLMPLVAMLAGGLLGGRLAALSMLTYLLLGLIGIPVFQKPPYGGLTYVLQPTFGFLVGFVAGAYVIGKILEYKERAGFLQYSLAMLAGLAVIYLIGLPYLYLVLNFYLGKAVSVMGVVKIGFLPYIVFDLGKAVVATLIARSVTERTRIAIGQRT